MASTVGALAPVFLMIALGWALRARGLLGDAFWPDAERLVYWLLFPALLFITTATSELAAFTIMPVALALVAAILLTAGLALLLRPLLGIGDSGFTSVFQGAIRNNTYVGLAGAGALYGEAGLAIMGIVVFVVVTTVNLLCVGALVYFGSRPAGWRALVVTVARNPLIIACLGGFVFNFVGLELPAVARASLEILGRASLTLGLLCVGAALDLSRLAASRHAVTATCGLKLVVMPANTALLCWVFNVQGLTAAAAILFTSAPISASSFVLARQLEGDAPLIAGLITLTTLGAVITMPLMIALLT